MGKLIGASWTRRWVLLDFLNQIDTIFYGRKSYDVWGQYIPKTEEHDSDKEMWDLVHSKEKYVFSKTQQRTDDKAVFINE